MLPPFPGSPSSAEVSYPVGRTVLDRVTCKISSAVRTLLCFVHLRFGETSIPFCSKFGFFETRFSDRRPRILDRTRRLKIINVLIFRTAKTMFRCSRRFAKICAVVCSKSSSEVFIIYFVYYSFTSMTTELFLCLIFSRY